MSSNGLDTPVDDSLCVSTTALYSGSFLSACSRVSRSAGFPSGNSSLVTSAPTASAISAKRIPNTPMIRDRTLSPGEIVFTTAVSMAPVPDDVMK